jgi:uncharacterized membrane protein HdeD (DUF308 family)
MGGIDIYVPVEDLKRGWWLLLVLGIASIAFGALLIFWPGRTITVVTTIIGLFMIVTGLVRFAVAVFDTDRENRWLLVIVGIMGVVLGVIIMRNPEETIRVVVLITAIFWLVAGMVDFFRGVTNRSLPDASLRVVFGAMSALFGLVILVWPEITVGVFAVLMGVYVVVFGMLEVLAAFQVKNA